MPKRVHAVRVRDRRQPGDHSHVRGGKRRDDGVHESGRNEHVVVHEHDRVAVACPHARVHRPPEAHVLGQLDQRDLGVLRAHQIGTAVRRRVVDDDHLLVRRVGAQRGQAAREQIPCTPCGYHHVGLHRADRRHRSRLPRPWRLRSCIPGPSSRPTTSARTPALHDGAEDQRHRPDLQPGAVHPGDGRQRPGPGLSERRARAERRRLDRRHVRDAARVRRGRAGPGEGRGQRGEHRHRRRLQPRARGPHRRVHRLAGR